MVPIQAFLFVAATLFSLGIYCLMLSDSKFAYLLSLEFCSGAACLILASGARYFPNQEILIWGLAVSLWTLVQLSITAALFFLSEDCSLQTIKNERQKDFKLPE